MLMNLFITPDYKYFWSNYLIPNYSGFYRHAFTTRSVEEKELVQKVLDGMMLEVA